MLSRRPRPAWAFAGVTDLVSIFSSERGGGALRGMGAEETFATEPQSLSLVQKCERMVTTLPRQQDSHYIVALPGFSEEVGS